MNKESRINKNTENDVLHRNSKLVTTEWLAYSLFWLVKLEHLLGAFKLQQYSGHDPPVVICFLASQNLTQCLYSLIFSHRLKETSKHIFGALCLLSCSLVLCLSNSSFFFIYLNFDLCFLNAVRLLCSSWTPFLCFLWKVPLDKKFERFILFVFFLRI